MTRENTQKAREKARELIQAAGKSVSVKEAERIERKTDVPIQRVLQIAEKQQVNVPQRVESKIQSIVQQRRGSGTSAPASNNTGVSNELTQFRGTGGGFGLASYRQAVDSGYSPSEILRLLPGSGLTVGEKAQTQLDQDWKSITDRATNAGYYAGLAERYKTEVESYETDVDDYKTKLSDYSSTFDNLKSQYSAALVQQQSASAQAASEKKRADDLEQQRKDEQELQVAQQVSSLRSGSTASGGGGTGLGSLSSGGTSRSIATGGRSGGILDRAYQDIDPTDSVLNRDVATSASNEVRSSGGSRAQARQRALTSGATAGQYYARRFG
jgi:hypothetical protein